MRIFISLLVESSVVANSFGRHISVTCAAKGMAVDNFALCKVVANFGELWNSLAWILANKQKHYSDSQAILVRLIQLIILYLPLD